MTAVLCESDSGEGPYAGVVTEAASVGMVGDRLEFFDQFGDLLGAFERE